MKIQPYLYFDGRAEEALDFYKQVLGAEVLFLMRFKDSPVPTSGQPDNANKIMHASFRIGETILNASDGNCKGEAKFAGISLTCQTGSAEDAERIYAALLEGGQVQMPMHETFFSPRFGMVADRFGVSWLVMVDQAAAR